MQVHSYDKMKLRLLGKLFLGSVHFYLGVDFPDKNKTRPKSYRASEYVESEDNDESVSEIKQGRNEISDA